MKLRAKVVWCVAVVQVIVAVFAVSEVRGEANFPDILGYKTSKCDFHMHTVFSDGLVWPTVRVDEAQREGLDVISITDHIEYQPHKKDVPTNHNRPYEIALPRAEKKNILPIKGAEITRDTPPGHFNAIFLKDINSLDTADLNDVMRAANKQNAFVFWNHPGWKPEAKGWFDIHTTLYENKWLHGIEVANGDTYYPEAHKWCLEKKLTMIGASDIHGPVVSWETMPGKHRTITLVFATERSAEAIKGALVAGRTAVWYGDRLIGKKEYLDAIFKAAIQVAKPCRRQGRRIWFEVTNNCALDLQMQRVGQHGQESVTLLANATTMVKARLRRKKGTATVSYIVTNLLIGPKESLPVELGICLD